MYQALLDSNIVPHNSYLWKIKIPLKIKVFVWLLYRDSILPKDNLAKRNWHENEMCCFCNIYEIVQYLFFDCALTKFIWRVIHLTIGLGLPNIRNIFGTWVLNMNSSNKQLLFVRIGAIFWVIWLSWNDVVFNRAPISSYM
jgi:hypothetical protein